MNEKYKSKFLQASEQWLCDGYSLIVRYTAVDLADAHRLINAAFTFAPRQVVDYPTFDLRIGEFRAGQFQAPPQKKDELFNIVQLAIQGKIDLNGTIYSLEENLAPDFYSEMVHRNRLNHDLHLRIGTNSPPHSIEIDFDQVNDGLRKSSIPFDGLADLLSWLDLKSPEDGNRSPFVEIRVLPPIDLLDSRLSMNKLSVDLTAHLNAELGHLSCGLRVFPGNGIAARKQVSDLFTWTPSNDALQKGHAEISVENADRVLIMLTMGDHTVRRYWVSDPQKARNTRLLATQEFDSNLGMIKQALFEQRESRKFEKAISALLFMMGFSCGMQVEDDSPDLIASTPSGRLILVECTLKMADWARKVGKLVDRHRSLLKSLELSGVQAEIYSFIVCGLPSDQIMHRPEELQSSKIILLAKEDLLKALEDINLPMPPDEVLDKLSARLTQKDFFR